MRIGFIGKWAPGDVHAWSGTPYFMRKALEARGHDVQAIGPLHIPQPTLRKGLRRAAGWAGMHVDIERSPVVARSYAKQAQAAIAGQPFDLLLSPSTLPLAHLQTNTPTVVWTDAVFGAMVGYYPGTWQHLAPWSRWQGMAMDKRAMAHINLSVFASQWAADAAMAQHGALPERTAVVPLGANLVDEPTQATVHAAIAARPSHTCHLLFVGVDWLRKGGQLVVDVAARLNAMGLPTTVDVVGCAPPQPQPAFVRCHGFVSKSTAEGRAQLDALFLQSHYLFVPSLAECYGLVFAEASAFGLPSIARRAGGIPTVVSEGLNGHLFALDEGPEPYAATLFAEFTTPHRYQQAAISARAQFEARLSWRASAQALEHLLHTRLGLAP